MKILILSAATGGGHLRASRAIQTYIQEHSVGNEVVVKDALKSIGPAVDKTICGGYHFLATKTPKMFGYFYNKTNKESSLSSVVLTFSNTFAKKLMPLLNSENPDIIISTHPFVTEMISHLKGINAVSAPLICIMTDYGSHKAWIADHVDAYVVSSEDMIPEMEEMGVPKAKIYPFGIPVENVFFTESDKPALLKKLELDPKLPAILIMAGSFGVSNILKIYSQISQAECDFQMVVITGRNKKLYNIFTKKINDSPKKTKLIFFTDEVENYMHACDILVTKPGGLTVSEALACNIPMAVFDAIPGQEEDNADFLLTHNMAIKLDKNIDYGATVCSLLENSIKLQNMRNSCGEFDKSHSAENILSLITELYEKIKKHKK